jgi:hypothetical protein
VRPKGPCGSTCYICVLLFHLYVIKGLFFCSTKPAFVVSNYFVRNKFHNCDTFILMFSKLCCLYGIELHFVAIL